VAVCSTLFCTPFTDEPALIQPVPLYTFMVAAVLSNHKSPVAGELGAEDAETYWDWNEVTDVLTPDALEAALVADVAASPALVVAMPACVVAVDA